ncbi:hypothetical protein [Streptomyces sp. NPDC046862]|uniref:hypothetical protein n=1 Tax=Streptomyces sp. NPDC046862 TaxID=3154603 RepID=UPI0034527090
MDTTTRETSPRVFPDHPAALTPVFDALGVPPPVKPVIERLSVNAPEISPPGHRMESVLKVDPSEGNGFLLAIDIQNEPDDAKLLNWACHVTHLQMTCERPVLLLVICRNRFTATWALGPFESRIGAWISHSLHPLVLGPDNLPEITDASTVIRQPALATLAAIAHGESPRITAAREALARGLRSLDNHTSVYLCELLEAGLLDAPARGTWRELLRPPMPEQIM